MSRARVIVNPRSAHGRTGRRWQRIARRLHECLEDPEIVHTEGPMHAAELARDALTTGFDTIVAVGGDGTVSETINGFFRNQQPINPGARLGIIMQGTGGDFRRSHDIPLDPLAQVEVVAAGHVRTIDLGRIEHVDHQGRERVRYFGNIASLGMSGEVCSAVNRARLTKLFGGRFAFHVASLATAVRYRNPRVELTLDDGVGTRHVANTVAVCNGRYFGGGMHIAPHARPDDGQFEVIVLGDIALRELAGSMNQVYRGTHLEHPKVEALTATRLTARAVDPSIPVLLEVDGEAPGRLPATFTVLPHALNLIAPPAIEDKRP